MSPNSRVADYPGDFGWHWPKFRRGQLPAISFARQKAIAAMLSASLKMPVALVKMNWVYSIHFLSADATGKANLIAITKAFTKNNL